MKYALSGSPVTPSTGLSSLTGLELHYKEQGLASDLHVSQPIEAFGLTHTFTTGIDFRRTDSRTQRGQVSLGSITAVNPTYPAEPATIAMTSNSESELNQGGLYAEARIKPAQPLTLIFGGRLSAYDLDVTNALTNTTNSRDETGVFTPSLGAVYDLTEDLSAYVSYTQVFQPQTQVTASGDLIEPRKSKQVEVGLKNEFLDDRLLGQIGFYRLIDTNRAMSDPDNSGTYLSSGKVVVKGIDAELSGSLTERLEVFGGYAYVLSETHADTSSVGATYSNWTPKHTVNLRARYSFDEGWLDDVWVAGGARYVSSYYGQNSAGTRWVQDGYALFDAQIGYALTEWANLTLTVNNIFDKTYYVRAGSNGSVFNYYGEPLNATVKLSVKF